MWFYELTPSKFSYRPLLIFFSGEYICIMRNQLVPLILSYIIEKKVFNVISYDVIFYSSVGIRPY